MSGGTLYTSAECPGGQASIAPFLIAMKVYKNLPLSMAEIMKISCTLAGCSCLEKSFH